MKSFLRRLVPLPFLLFYHKTLALVAAVVYRFPSRHLIVIGVTGTNGKTTVCNLLWHILTEAGLSSGLATTINFKIGKLGWVNRTKQGMQGRFALQKMLRKMVGAGCQYAVIETTSEGIKQYRHLGIRYDVAVFTNLTLEHIEAHGSFENYKQAKGEMFRVLKHPHWLTRLLGGKRNVKKVSVVNGDDPHAQYFLGFGADEKWGYGVMNYELRIKNYADENLRQIWVKKYRLSEERTEFAVEWQGKQYNVNTRLLGAFNIYNCAAAVATALSQGIGMDAIARALETMQPVPGRMEIINDPARDITVIVDYAHDPAALEAVYQTIRELRITNYELRNDPSIIAVLGAVGGGRDRAKRPKLGALAARYAKYVIITNEDPYDDDPMEIIEQVETGVKQDSKRESGKNYWKILDRREAIKKAVELACSGDIIAVTGKGAEEVMAVKGGMVAWDDRVVVKDVLGVSHDATQ